MQFYVGVGGSHGSEMSESGVTTICLLMNQDPAENNTPDLCLLQHVPIPAKIQQLRTAIEQGGATFHRPQSTLCERDVSHCMRQMAVGINIQLGRKICVYCSVVLLCVEDQV